MSMEKLIDYLLVVVLMINFMMINVLNAIIIILFI